MAAFVIPTIFSAVDQLSAVVRRMTGNLETFGQKAAKVSQRAAVGAAVIAAPLILAAKQAVDFEDKMSDVAKTTGLTGAALDSFGQDLLKYSKTTRSSIEDLQIIAEIGGQLGVPTAELRAFTKSANEFNVALGSDFTGGVEEAISSIGKIKSLFKDTRDMAIADVITKTGSAVNQLGAVGAGTSRNINEFVLRIGQLPDAIKPSLVNTAALGTLFEETGLNAEIASGGLSNLFLVAGQGIGGFAKQMRLSEKAARSLLSAHPEQFALTFAASLKNLDSVQLSKKLKELKVGSQETIKAVGSLGANTKRFAELQEVANQAFAEGTSLSQEYATKNATTAAKLAMVRNNTQAFMITLGTKLLPILTRVLDKLTPIIGGLVDWIGNNPGLTKGLIVLALGVSGFLSALSGVAGAISAVIVIKKAWTTVNWAVVRSLLANPITWIILAIVALIAIIAVVIKKTKGWGEQWDEVVKWMTAVIETYKNIFILTWLKIKDAFMSAVEAMVKGYYWFANKIGDISDEQYKKNIAQIEGEKKARLDAISVTNKALMESARTVGQGVDWKLRWDDGKEEVKAANPKQAQQSGMEAIMAGMTGSVDVNVAAQSGSNATVTKSSGIAKPTVKPTSNKW